VFGAKVAGEAFNVSNNEPVLNEDFWFSVIKVMRQVCDPARIKSHLDFVYIPEAPLWLMSYVSELNQKIFKGKVSLGHDIDMMSPGMMTTATMAYTYNSKKAMRCLGYDAAYGLDEVPFVRVLTAGEWHTNAPHAPCDLAAGHSKEVHWRSRLITTRR